MDEEKVRWLAQANPSESTEDAVRRLAEEVIEWRGACEAAFGIVTATPRKTLLDLVAAQRAREIEAWKATRTMAVRYSVSSVLTIADEHLGALGED